MSLTSQQKDLLETCHKKTLNQLSQNKKDGLVVPMLCYALDPEFLSDDVCQIITEHIEEIIDGEKPHDFHGKIALCLILFHMKSFYSCNGSSTWQCLEDQLPIKSASNTPFAWALGRQQNPKSRKEEQRNEKICKSYLDYLLNDDFLKGLGVHDDQRGQVSYDYTEYFKYHCPFLEVAEGVGEASVRLRNNARVGLSKKCNDLMEMGWYELTRLDERTVEELAKSTAQAFIDANIDDVEVYDGQLNRLGFSSSYIHSLLSKAPKHYLLSLKALISGDLGPEHWGVRDRWPWLYRIHCDSLENRATFSAKWNLRGVDNAYELSLLFEGDVPKTIQLLSDIKYRISNEKILFCHIYKKEEALVANFKDSVGYGIKPFDVSEPQVFVKTRQSDQYRLVHENRINSANGEMLVFIPNSFMPEAHFELKHGDTTLKMREKSLKGDLPYRLYSAETYSNQKASLYLVDLNDIENSAYQLVESFGIDPEIEFSDEKFASEYRSINLPDAICLVSDLPSFKLSFIPNTVKSLKWCISQGQTTCQEYKDSLHGNGEFQMRQGSWAEELYTISVEDENGKLISEKKLIYLNQIPSAQTGWNDVSDLRDLRSARRVFSKELNGESHSIERNARSGEGTWRWSFVGNPVDCPACEGNNLKKPQDWLSSGYKLQFFLKYRSNAKIRHDINKLTLNGTHILRILGWGVMRNINQENFLQTLFSSVQTYEFFRYGEPVYLKYGGVDVCCWLNFPTFDIPFALMRRKQGQNDSWILFSSEGLNNPVNINGEDVPIHPQHDNIYKPMAQHKYELYQAIKTFKVGGQDLKPRVKHKEFKEHTLCKEVEKFKQLHSNLVVYTAKSGLAGCCTMARAFLARRNKDNKPLYSALAGTINHKDLHQHYPKNEHLEEMVKQGMWDSQSQLLIYDRSTVDPQIELKDLNLKEESHLLEALLHTCVSLSDDEDADALTQMMEDKKLNELFELYCSLAESISTKYAYRAAQMLEMQRKAQKCHKAIVSYMCSLVCVLELHETVQTELDCELPLDNKNYYPLLRELLKHMSQAQQAPAGLAFAQMHILAQLFKKLTLKV